MLTVLGRYPDSIKDLKGFRCVSVEALDVAIECVVYVRRETERRGVRWMVGTIRDMTEDRQRVRVWISGRNRVKWFHVSDVRVVVAA
jgi:hypothetical protein